MLLIMDTLAPRDLLSIDLWFPRDFGFQGIRQSCPVAVSIVRVIKSKTHRLPVCHYILSSI